MEVVKIIRFDRKRGEFKERVILKERKVIYKIRFNV